MIQQHPSKSIKASKLITLAGFFVWRRKNPLAFASKTSSAVILRGAKRSRRIYVQRFWFKNSRFFLFPASGRKKMFALRAE
jgi:hypothetical protein